VQSTSLKAFGTAELSEVTTLALNEREDLQAMSKAIDVAQSTIELAKSKNYLMLPL